MPGPPDKSMSVIKEPSNLIAPLSVAGPSAEDQASADNLAAIPEVSRNHELNVKRRRNRRHRAAPVDDTDEPKKKWYLCIYDKQNKTFCGRNCMSWLCIIAYTTMYLVFLMTFTMIFLYVSLLIIKATANNVIFKVYMYSYKNYGIGLSATPSSENPYPLIWYQNGDSSQYQKYISALDRLLENNRRRRKREGRFSELGPCGTPPYGYGKTPCVIVRVNKQHDWVGEPIKPDSPVAEKAPPEVISWLRKDRKKLWLHCSGYYPWDIEHLGKIKYYPYPPGIDASIFPMNMTSKSPLIGIQFSNFTIGMSIAVECKLWYAKGPSAVRFVLYVGPDKDILKLKSIKI